jgi:hypothetical protein
VSVYLGGTWGSWWPQWWGRRKLESWSLLHVPPLCTLPTGWFGGLKPVWDAHASPPFTFSLPMALGSRITDSGLE